ncbi:tryptophan halogenase family protein [Pseudocolwellia agarivorans]|uniref:tryptophan halogenase family protein n=1 Tax=Pseudocolwellia agarivorans TaxID=1911682 RepID=UPI003F882619
MTYSNIPNTVKSVVIVGGGSAGWMTAAALSKVLGTQNCDITLIESDQIGTVSVGEATIPQIQLFNRILEVDEKEFLEFTQATFKLGIEFVDWRKKDHSYMHPFGAYGTNIEALPFHHYWLKMQQEGGGKDLSQYSLAAVAAYQNKFMHPQPQQNSPLAGINYAYHFDAILYAKFLSNYSIKKGVKRIVGKVVDVGLKAENGFIKEVFLEDKQCISGDLFIDCSGFKGLLIEQALKTGFDDWSHFLPCNRAVAVPCDSTQDLKPYTQSIAQDVGWRWRIPLQHRVGNGYVYASDFISDAEAKEVLLKGLESEPIADINTLRWTTGMRKKSWNKNCIAIGLSAGFVEPLESTGVHLIQSAIAKLMTLFPTKQFHQCDIDMFNQQTEKEYQRIRDFIVLHYKVTERDDSPFWDYCRNMSIPSTLQQKIEMYQETGRIFRQDDELFNETSWLAVMQGQGIQPKSYHPLVDRLPVSEIERRLRNIESVIQNSADIMPGHHEYIKKHCML